MKRQFFSILHYWLVLVLILEVAVCQRVDAQNTSDSFALVPVWTRVGDTDGVVDEDRGITSIESAEFSPDGRFIVSAAKQAGEVRLWTIEGEQLWKRTHENEPDDEVEVVGWTRDGNYVITAGEDFTIRVWTADEGKPVRSWRVNASIDGMRFSHSGNMLATGTESGEIYIWDTSNTNPEKWPDEPLHVLIQGPDQDRSSGGSGHSDVNSIDWTTDDRIMITAGRNAVVKAWDVSRFGEADGGLIRAYEGFLDSIKSTRLSADGRFIAAGGQRSPDGLVLVWNAETGELVRRIDYPMTSKIETVEFTPNGRYLLTGGIEGSERDEGYPGNQGIGHIRIYDSENGFQLVDEVEVFRQEYFHFNAEGTRMVSSHEDGTLRLWEVRY